MPLQPDTTEERWLAVAARLDHPARREFFTRKTGGWRSAGLVTRIALFALGAVTAMMAATIMSLLGIPGHTIVVGLILLLVAEWLIVARRFSHVGIEEGLHVSGLLLLAYGTFGLQMRDDGVMIVASVAAALLLAGWRLRNPLFSTLAACGLSVLVALLSHRSGWLWGNANGHWAAGFCYAVAIIALAAGAHSFARPSPDRMLDWLVVAMPLAAFLWATELFGIRALGTLKVALALLLFGGLALLVGLRRRTHAPLWSAMICIGCIAVELRHLSGWTLSTRLMVWGAATLIVALVLNRWLRQPRNGVTSARCNQRAGPLELLPLAGAATLTPQSAPTASPGYQGGGGGFSGGGAEGRF